MESLGSVTKKVFEKHESHKLHQCFTASGAIRKGSLIMLNADGTVSEAAAATSELEVIGCSLETVADGEEVTAAVRGYVIVKGLATAVQDAGPVKLGTYDATTGLWHYTTVADLATEPVHGWALEEATAISQEIEVMIKN
jgi:hypothetical protein